jgi:hypothetical protein
VGFAGTFYATAGWAGAFGVLYGGYFALRLGRTASGVLGGLAAAEAELLAPFQRKEERGGGDPKEPDFEVVEVVSEGFDKKGVFLREGFDKDPLTATGPAGP